MKKNFALNLQYLRKGIVDFFNFHLEHEQYIYIRSQSLVVFRLNLCSVSITQLMWYMFLV